MGCRGKQICGGGCGVKPMQLAVCHFKKMKYLILQIHLATVGKKPKKFRERDGVTRQPLQLFSFSA